MPSGLASDLYGFPISSGFYFSAYPASQIYLINQYI